MGDGNDIENEPLVNDGYINHQHNSQQGTFFKSFGFQKFLYHSCFVALSIIYLSISVGLPFFNKELLIYYNFPITASFFQTMGSTIILVLFNIIQYTQQKSDLIQRSYFFDKHFLYKNLIMFPVSLCFAAVMILTNLGIQSAPINIHIVFKSTNIVWVIIFSILINKERPSIYEYISAGALIVGSILVSLDYAESHGSTLPIILNLASSFFESFTIVILKWACANLYKNDETITVIEISLFKVLQASIIIMVPMFIIEKAHGFDFHGLHDKVTLMILSGIAITIVYQTAVVWLSKSLYSFTVGLISQVQIVPQIIISAFIFHTFTSTKLHIVGLVLCISACLLFTLYNFFKVYPNLLVRLKSKLFKILRIKPKDSLLNDDNNIN